MAATIKVAAGDATDFATPALVVNLFQGVTQPAAERVPWTAHWAERFRN